MQTEYDATKKSTIDLKVILFTVMRIETKNILWSENTHQIKRKPIWEHNKPSMSVENKNYVVFFIDEAYRRKAGRNLLISFHSQANNAHVSFKSTSRILFQNSEKNVTIFQKKRYRMVSKMLGYLVRTKSRLKTFQNCIDCIDNKRKPQFRIEFSRRHGRLERCDEPTNRSDRSTRLAVPTVARIRRPSA